MKKLIFKVISIFLSLVISSNFQVAFASLSKFPGIFLPPGSNHAPARPKTVKGMVAVEYTKCLMKSKKLLFDNLRNKRVREAMLLDREDYKEYRDYMSGAIYNAFFLDYMLDNTSLNYIVSFYLESEGKTGKKNGNGSKHGSPVPVYLRNRTGTLKRNFTVQGSY